MRLERKERIRIEDYLIFPFLISALSRRRRRRRLKKKIEVNDESEEEWKKIREKVKAMIACHA